MTTNTNWAVAAAALLALAQGCSLLKSSEDDAKNKVVTVGGGGSTAGTGAGARGGASTGGSASGGVATGGAGGTSAGGASAGGVGGTSAPTCSGLAGPLMVAVQAPNGTQYCIDRTEVTQADYALFLKQTTSKPGSEDSRCQDNTSYAPLNNPVDPIEPKLCMDSFNPTTAPNHPVVCIDWCDAQAYCKWAGKRLCGKIGGGPGSSSTKPDDPANPANDASVSQWFNACSQGGKTKYPYGDTYDAAACQGAAAKAEGGTSVELADVATSPGCRGTAAPYSSIFDLSGSAWELTDECATGMDYLCALRGGGKSSYSGSDLACAVAGGVNLGQHFQDMGFRCCKDLQ